MALWQSLIKPAAWGVGSVIVVEMMASRGVYVWRIVLLESFQKEDSDCICRLYKPVSAMKWELKSLVWKESFGCLGHGWITEKADWARAQKPPEPVKKLWIFPVGKSSNFQRMQNDYKETDNATTKRHKMTTERCKIGTRGFRMITKRLFFSA